MNKTGITSQQAKDILFTKWSWEPLEKLIGLFIPHIAHTKINSEGLKSKYDKHNLKIVLKYIFMTLF